MHTIRLRIKSPELGTLQLLISMLRTAFTCNLSPAALQRVNENHLLYGGDFLPPPNIIICTQILIFVLSSFISTM